MEEQSNKLVKTPSHSESEEALLSCIFLEKDCLEKAVEVLEPSDFYIASNRIIFETVVDMVRKGISVDLITLNNELLSKDVLESVGGVQKISLISTALHTTANFNEYLNIILEKSRLRSIVELSQKAVQLSMTDKEDSFSILSYITKKIDELQSSYRSDDFVNLPTVTQKVVEKLEILSKSDKSITGLSTGFIDLDKLTAGFQPSTLVLIAARPAVGKTSFSLNLATNIALAGKKVAYFSLEMSGEELANRVISSTARIDASRARTGNLLDEDWISIVETLPILAQTHFYINDTAGATIYDIKNKSRKLSKEQGLDIIFIDYLQIMSSHSKSDNRQQVISEISRELKILSKELEIPVIALSQLSRAVESRSDHRPMLSDLRESGAIEQDADIVSFLYKDHLYDPEADPNIVELIVAKHRAGSTGTITLGWDGDQTRFYNVEFKYDEFGNVIE